MIQKIFFLIFISVALSVQADNIDSVIVYKLNIKEEIGPAVWLNTQQAISEARRLDAHYFLVHMNTYGGLVESADSIRTALLNFEKTVIIFIDNNAASAGALISIAGDSIYMRKGANIGAATVVNQSGEQVPDKYQSYMRSMMRSTAEAQGKDTIITSTADTIIKWKRDPKIAEAMVEPKVKIAGIIDSGMVLTFTTLEAIQYGFCEGQAENIDQVLQLAGITNYKIVEYKPSQMERLIGVLVSPYLQSILIMIIIGGIYFELQTPGVGFPLLAALIAAILYFAPLYLGGLAEHWEVAMFFAGLILIALEIFVIPGFGITGILGIILMIAGLALAMVESLNFSTPEDIDFSPLGRSMFLVTVSTVIALIGSITLAGQMFKSTNFSFWVLTATQEKEQGFVHTEINSKNALIGKQGTTATVLRPSGKVEINGELYDAQAINGFIDKGETVQVLKFETGQIYVKKYSTK